MREINNAKGIAMIYRSYPKRKVGGTMTLIDWIALGVMLLGVILLIVEVYAPGFGLPGLAGLLFCAAGIAVMVAAAFGFTLYSASKGRLSRSKLLLNDAVTEKAGYADFDALGDWVGKQGVAISPLRPAGVVEIEGKRLDVVTRGEFLAEGESVRIAQVQGRQIIVCRI